MIQKEKMLGAFVFDLDDKIPTDVETIQRGPILLDSGEIYEGQWTVDGLKHGRGTLIMQESFKYVGYWIYDMANGKGRLLYWDGDVYEGEWFNN